MRAFLLIFNCIIMLGLLLVLDKFEIKESFVIGVILSMFLTELELIRDELKERNDKS